MNDADFGHIWEKLTQAWPRWKTTSGVQNQWAKLLRDYSSDSIEAAIDEHWQETGGKWEPDPAQIKKLARGGNYPTQSKDQHLYNQWFYSLSILDQNRELLRKYQIELGNDRFENQLERDRCFNKYSMAVAFIRLAETALYQMKDQVCTLPIMPKRACRGCPKENRS